MLWTLTGISLRRREYPVIYLRIYPCTQTFIRLKLHWTRSAGFACLRVNSRAFQRLDLHTDRDEPNELTFLEDSIIGTGTAYGWFVFLLGEGDIPPLPDTSKNLLFTLDELGKEINRPFWEKAVDEGIQDARCDRAIAALERM